MTAALAKRINAHWQGSYEEEKIIHATILLTGNTPVQKNNNI